jgi:hypothetical protein
MLARKIGATLTAGDRVLLSVPMDVVRRDDRPHHIHPDEERALLFDPIRLGDRETRDDLGSPR